MLFIVWDRFFVGWRMAKRRIWEPGLVSASSAEGNSVDKASLFDAGCCAPHIKEEAVPRQYFWILREEWSNHGKSALQLGFGHGAQQSNLDFSNCLVGWGSL